VFDTELVRGALFFELLASLPHPPIFSYLGIGRGGAGDRIALPHPSNPYPAGIRKEQREQ